MDYAYWVAERDFRKEQGEKMPRAAKGFHALPRTARHSLDASLWFQRATSEVEWQAIL
jgi:hypothetical protein